ncbi:uncharacterized protein EKO05_0007542 [Ascochyta rabiei]|uniref:uncharacterized protein n=1 Tax=Didymella rabiei TaxID=5454 RepID=UPI0022037851|nr:uncharacterized protein EKO05_0007542 [Ascochyta rabiei]UPX17170.1 hypothetical protein EKO05_0007542 [Ascochyta rabiei]
MRDSSSTSSDSPMASDYRIGHMPSHPRKPIPRKGHTKSRRGCFNCKRRRIKCNEKHPRCAHCVKAGLQCDYPANIIQLMQRSTRPSHPQEAVNLRSTPGIFTMADMRLFHHFIITAYPHIPVGADKIWVTVIPGFAHNYEYLMHSILALAASHLDAVSSISVAEQAIQHRILAVKSLNEALSVPPKSKSEQDARMAAALALAFQSSHLQDGLAEFLTMVRGCNLIASDGLSLGSDSPFKAFGEDSHLQQMKHRIGTAPPFSCLNQGDLDLAATSLSSIGYLNMSPFEHAYRSALDTTIQNAYDRPIDAYTSFVTLYNIPSRWSNDEFQAFIDPNNSIAQILQAHFIAVQAILTPILYLERVGFEGINAPTAVMSWIEGIYRNVPHHLRHHCEWPRQVSRYPYMRFLGQRNTSYFDKQAEDLELLGL